MSEKTDKYSVSARRINNLAMGDNVNQHNTGDTTMGDKTEVKTGDITNSGGQLFVGKTSDVTAILNAAGQNELAKALSDLKEALMANEQLSDDDKQEQAEIINQIGKEASKPKPNKTMLKMLGNGLITTLKTIPDLAKAVGAVAPLLDKLYS